MSRLRALVADRRLIAELVRRDIRSRFMGARFGLLWSILNPAIQLTAYGLIFSFLYRSMDGVDGRDRVASLLCGLWPWWAFQEASSRGLAAIVDQGALLKKVPLPTDACVTAAVLSSFLLQHVGFALFLVAFGVLGRVPLELSWLLVPAVASLGLALALGLALLTAPIYVVVRDTVHVITAMLTVGFFASPVLYELQDLPESIRGIAALNPVAGLLGLYRAVCLGADLPEAQSLITLVAMIGALWWLSSRAKERLAPYLDEYL